MQKTQDRILEKQARSQFYRWYVTEPSGKKLYFTRFSQASKIADQLDTVVKPLHS